MEAGGKSRIALCSPSDDGLAREAAGERLEGVIVGIGVVIPSPLPSPIPRLHQLDQPLREEGDCVLDSLAWSAGRQRRRRKYFPEEQGWGE